MTSHVYVDISRRMETGFHEVIARARAAARPLSVEERTERWAGEQDGIRFAAELLRVDGSHSMKAQLILLEVAAATRRMFIEVRAHGLLTHVRALAIEAAYAEGYYCGIMAVVAVAWPMAEEETA